MEKKALQTAEPVKSYRTRAGFGHYLVLDFSTSCPVKTKVESCTKTLVPNIGKALDGLAPGL